MRSRATALATGRFVCRARAARRSRLASLAAIGALMVAAPALAQDDWRVVERISVASDGTQANDESILGIITPDGRYATFSSHADNLVPGDTNGARDAFLRDRWTGQTTRISIASDGTQGNGESTAGYVSDDGRFVGFSSEATNLVSGDTNGVSDVFVHDRQTGQTTRVSVASDGTQGNRFSGGVPDLTPDGRFVTFQSGANNLVPGDTNGFLRDVFVHDRQTGQTTRVSVASDGTEGNGLSLSSSLSADGRFVAFFSLASTLVEGDTNGVADVFLHDRQAGQTTRVSVASGGAQGDAASSFGFGVISRDGRFITFPSGAGNLVDGDTNGAWDVFVHDAQTGQTARVSLAPDGSQSSGDLIGAPFPSISGDGRLVAFRSAAADLVAGDTNGIRDCFIHDRGTGQTRRASVAADGTQSDGECTAVLINGRFALLMSHATNLVPGDTNGVRDVFLAERTLSPGEALQELIDTVAGMGLPQGIANSLTAKLETALRMLTDDDPSNDTAACGTLAAFVGEVEAQESAGRLSPGQAATLVEAARIIAANSSCS